MTINFVNEFQINEQTKLELNGLLQECFPDTAYNGRTFLKQLPHYRLILSDNNQLVGHLGIDFRTMNLNGEQVKVLGIIDLAIKKDLQKKGLGAMLMKKMEEIVLENKHNIDFIFLVTHNPKFYERLGYSSRNMSVTWLKIYQEKNIGVGTEIIDDCFLMHKSVNGKVWSDGELDMLGYWY